MANHPSALKRHRQSVKRHARNQIVKTRVRNLVRAFREALRRGDPTAARAEFLRAARALDKAVVKGVFHRNNASRRIARLAKAVDRLEASAR
ncbi:MAG TPA: 30S ribosomal protein S20 [Candidatus Limnocylindria bacterium]|nr:30S ribosomal protein S20 [Candidatus Limnocylindria bacterium]